MSVYKTKRLDKEKIWKVDRPYVKPINEAIEKLLAVRTDDDWLELGIDELEVDMESLGRTEEVC